MMMDNDTLKLCLLLLQANHVDVVFEIKFQRTVLTLCLYEFDIKLKQINEI